MNQLEGKIAYKHWDLKNPFAKIDPLCTKSRRSDICCWPKSGGSSRIWRARRLATARHLRSTLLVRSSRLPVGLMR